jgi:large subunit ribosomal protein L29
MKAIELKDLSIEELKRRLSDEQESLANLRFQLATSQLESPIRVRTVRRDIARIQTLLHRKEQAAALTAGQATKTENTEVKTS